MRWSATATLATLAALALPQAATAAPTPDYRAGDYADGQAMSILPPGENGLVNGTDLAAFFANGTRPANSDDGLAKYAGLLHAAPSLTDATLGNYFDDESFGVKPEDVVRTEHPAGDVAIYRDRNGIPHVYGDTDEAMAFGAGYAQAEDRLFLMDVLRHYGAGDLASFLGASCEFEQMDHDQLLLAPYTPERAQEQIDALPAQYGDQGALARSLITAYVRGINAYIAATRTNPALLPADYGAALQPPLPWTPADVVSVAGLIGGIFGKGGGGELANARLLDHLEAKLGSAAGRAAFTELKHQDDPSAPTTTANRFDYEHTPAAVDPATTALPDDPSAPLHGGPTATTPGCDVTPANATATKIVDALDTMPAHMSNALVVNANRTTAGHPIAVFGPQVSYFAPQILSVIDLHSPHYSAMGASFPGTGLVELGRGPDFAWSATSAGTDIIDQRLERVCDPNGGTPQPEGKFVEFEGRCVPMVHEDFTEVAVPKPGGVGLPTRIVHDIYRTRHGVVQGWTESGGAPVAIVNERSTYEHDIDSVVGFLRWGQPALTHDVASWKEGAAEIGYTFNWFYVDTEHTGYFASGRDPVRRPDVDPDLPTWGTGNAEWQGMLPAAQHPQDSDPASGTLVSWNNKPAPGFSAADDQYGYGQVFRSQMLTDQLDAQLAAHPGGLVRSDVVKAMEAAATQDLDGLEVLPPLLDAVGDRPQPAGVRAMLDQLRAWQADGAHRLKDRPTDAQYRYPGAVATMDELEPAVIRAFFDPLLASGGLGDVGSSGGAATQGYSVLPMQFVNTPNSGGAHLGSAYDGGYEGNVRTLLQQVAGAGPADAFTPTVTDRLCGASGLASCPAALDEALAATYAALVKANGGRTDPATWTASTESAAANESMPTHDAIQHRALGIVGQPAIEWQNRPTFQQVVQFPRGRLQPADGPGAGAGTGTGTPADGTVPAPGAVPGPGASGGAGTGPGGSTSLGTGATPCSSTRRVVVHLPRALRSARATLNGRRVAVRTRRGRLQVTVDLRGRRGTRAVRLRVTARTAAGARVHRTRTFRPCRAKAR